MSSYEPDFKILDHIKIREIVFSAETDLTLMSKVRNQEFHYYEFWNIFCDYNIITEILLYVGDVADPIITKLTDILSSSFIEEPTVIDIVSIIGHELIVDGLTLKVYKTMTEGENGRWLDDPHDNCLEIDSIISNNEMNKDRQVIKKAKKAGDLLNDYYTLLDNSFNFYLQLLNKGFSIEDARSRTGLKDELLYRIAITRNDISKFHL